jgi:hypothetical protein
MKLRFAISEHIHQASLAQVDVQDLFINSTTASHTIQRFVRPISSNSWARDWIRSQYVKKHRWHWLPFSVQKSSCREVIYFHWLVEIAITILRIFNHMFLIKGASFVMAHVYTWLVVWNIRIMFPYIGNNHHPNWNSYFSEGLAPPTRLLLASINHY